MEVTQRRQNQESGSNRGRTGAGLPFTDLLFDLAPTSERPETDMWLPSGLA